MTTKAKTPATKPVPQTIRDLAVAAAGNIETTDQVAVLVVIQKDGIARVTPIKAAVTEAVQALSLGTVLLAKAIQATTKTAVSTPAPATT